jgi:endoglucanase
MRGRPRRARLRLPAAALGAAVLAAALAAGVLVSMLHGPGPPAVPTATGTQGLHVQGRQIVNGRGRPVVLTGFNNAGAEYACEDGWGIFDKPRGTTLSSVVAGMRTWAGANAVRLPVNEQCWLGLPGLNPAYAGAPYRHAIEQYVALLTSHGFAVILDLAGTAPDGEHALNEEEMPDSSSIAFWRSAAAVFLRNSSVLFDLFNEPWPLRNAGTPAAWACWRDGGCTETSRNGGERYRAVGMQQLVDVVRSTGARNIIIAEGIQYAADVGHWLEYRPRDPAGNLIASVHVYSYNPCSALRCYNGAMRRVAARVPLLIGEFGPDVTISQSVLASDGSCPASDIGSASFDRTLLGWARRNGASWTAWTWNAWEGACWSLIRSFDGTPTSPYGVMIKSALAHWRN